MPTARSQRLARFVAEVAYADLAAAVIDKAKACLRHFLGVGIAGAESLAALIARRTEDAPVIRGPMPEMALPVAQVERLTADLRHPERLSDVDQLLALTIAADRVAS